MAFQRDYVLRLIERMGEFFRRLSEMADDAEKKKKLDSACRDQCGLSLDAALKLNEETLSRLLPPQGVMMLSEMAYLRAKLEKDEEKESAFHLLTIRLLSSLYKEEVLCAVRANRLRELMDACAPLLSPDDYMRCARFFMAGEYYAHGEDAVFLAVESAEAPGEYIEEGISLFSQLLSLPEHALTLGGLPSEDVKAAINDLKTWELT